MTTEISPHRVKSRVDGVNYNVMTRTARGFFLLGEDDFLAVNYDIIRFLTQVYFAQLHTIAVMSNHCHRVLHMGGPQDCGRFSIHAGRSITRLQDTTRLRPSNLAW